MKQSPIVARTRQLLADHNLSLKKSLGQHFLVDQRVLERIIEAAELDSSTGVLEIGPGMGALTERLADRAGAVLAVEIDDRLIPILRELFSDRPHVTVVHGDALKVDLRELIKRHLGSARRFSVVANLPYYVTSPILMRLLEERLPLDRIVVMIQKEVAERILAGPGTKEYGSLSVAVRYFAEVSWICGVPRNCFVPRPQVDSAVIRLRLRREPAVSVRNEALFFRAVRAAFAQRRKTLANALSAAFFGGKRKEELGNLLTDIGIDPGRRGETLTLEEFGRLADALDRMIETR
ncbi:dimethyladenosine transferase [Planifilum fulgidum]|jgi:16S rRNA (adenine1518-N6/adenine1519-N6)-dimethyltransferase|uniref:Ribosomal RNA small subunit methyltransferase A n=1 Tax=Planifilum fulgidum TaxID=201973 RepID=A0A1I2PZJ0_9BACL|nr:16S rRNA (adenine(1518)-N(6)/adenine(1519)-N(6))-dimethyltransferase RsmA [Planifilum fulgidum]MBO2497595.1 16S rRNA (adenine(1518)-N(6)/adenine(1519)-N(6))-dimethyltransferase RsmA [Bacillota bacterium]MBO2532637.1 16S rRNA (adenine(1518)-N(6)/adenine(1519)-N(6))-dimethyltransferase RsmA [Thermoactinomycetaceae bacterium]SFG19427.1 dimethyladenosine transferase [Planifilum fulgidum]